MILHPKRFIRRAKKFVHDLFFYYLISDRAEIRYRYKKKKGIFPDLSNPRTFTEKIQWLKLYDRNPNYSIFVDKYRVKEIVAKIIGEEYIIPTLCGGYKSYDDIPFGTLPNAFVLKCNHDAASTIICKDKQSFDTLTAKNRLSSSLKRNYYHEEGKQWAYKDIEPCILVEQYMHDVNQEDLIDYKFMCFNGTPKCIYVCMGRFSSGLTIDVFDLEWNHMPIIIDEPNSKSEIKPPKNLKKMIELAETLSKQVSAPFVRVDLYEIKYKIYFGELTFYPNGGFGIFTPEKWDNIFGEWLDISQVNKKRS